MSDTRKKQERRKTMRPRKGDILVAFIGGTGMDYREIVYREHVTPRARAAIEAARDAWLDVMWRGGYERGQKRNRQ